MNTPTAPQKRKYSTEKVTDRWEGRRIVIPMRYEEYEKAMQEPSQAHKTIAKYKTAHPELFPAQMDGGYKLHGWTRSCKMSEVQLRRIRLAMENAQGQKLAYTIVPCDILPYMTGKVSEVEKALFLKQFGVPDWGLTYVFGRNDSYWYRQSVAFGRCNIVGTTVKQADKLPVDLLADEKHAKAHGEKWYIATTVGDDCVLGASVSTSADAVGLKESYGVFKSEAQQLDPEYQPNSVNLDGWAATSKAWRALFKNVTVILCFLHAFIKIRDRCKRLGDQYDQIKQQVWDIYHADSRTQFYQRVRQLTHWVTDHHATLTAPAISAIEKLCSKADKFCLAFDHPTAYRTSNMIDRHMQPMARFLSATRFFHGHLHSAELRVRSWALLHNYLPYCPRSKISDSFTSPAHQLNGVVYCDNWLENLLVSSSCQTFRFRHKKRQN